jgi:hypothetical protein
MPERECVVARAGYDAWSTCAVRPTAGPAAAVRPTVLGRVLSPDAGAEARPASAVYGGWSGSEGGNTASGRSERASAEGGVSGGVSAHLHENMSQGPFRRSVMYSGAGQYGALAGQHGRGGQYGGESNGRPAGPTPITWASPPPVEQRQYLPASCRSYWQRQQMAITLPHGCTYTRTCKASLQRS